MMPGVVDNCKIKRLFSIRIKHDINTLCVKRVFRNADLSIVVGHRDGVLRTYDVPKGETELTASCTECTASYETKSGPIQALVVHDVTRLSGFGDVVATDSRGVVTVFSNKHILCRKSISDQCISCLQIDSDTSGNFGIVTADRDGNVYSFTPYFDLWALRLLDVRQAKGIGGRSAVSCMKAVALKSLDGRLTNYILVADELQQLYFIQHGTVVLILQTPEVITAMCCGRFVNGDQIETSSSSSAAPSPAFETQVALASDTGSIFIMTNFQIYQEPYANIHLPISHLQAFSTASVDLLLAAGNCDSFTVLSPAKVVASFKLPTWTSALDLADIDKDGVPEVIISCRDNTVHGLKLTFS